MTALRVRALAIAILLAGTAPVAASPLALPEGAFPSGNLIRVQAGGGDMAQSEGEARMQRREARRQREDFDRRNPEARFSRPSIDSGRFERRVDRPRFDAARVDRRWDRARFDRSDRIGWYNGYRGSRSWRRGHRYHDGWWFPLAAFATGAFVGGAFASAPPVYAYPPPTYVVPPPTTYVQPAPSFGVPLNQAHVDWCRAKYRSYDARTDTFQPYRGPRKRCDSPYA